MVIHRDIELWIENSKSERFVESGIVQLYDNKATVTVDVPENTCYVARWRTITEPLSAQCELFVDVEGKDTRASILCMEEQKKKTRTSRDNLCRPFTKYSMLRTPLCISPYPGYVRLELRRFQGEVQKSDSEADEFIVDWIDDPKVGDGKPYITLEIRFKTFPKHNAKPINPLKRTRDDEDNANSGPRPSGSGKSKQAKKTRARPSPRPEEGSDSDDPQALLREMKAAEKKQKEVMAAARTKLAAMEKYTADLKKLL